MVLPQCPKNLTEMRGQGIKVDPGGQDSCGALGKGGKGRLKLTLMVSGHTVVVRLQVLGGGEEG